MNKLVYNVSTYEIRKCSPIKSCFSTNISIQPTHALSKGSIHTTPLYDACWTSELLLIRVSHQLHEMVCLILASVVVIRLQ